MKKIDSICSDITEIKVSIGKIEEHLKLQNGTLMETYNRSENNEKYIEKMKGGMTVLGFLTSSTLVILVLKTLWGA